MESPTTVTYKTAGCPIRLDVYPGPAGAPAPVVVHIHGGALMGGARAPVHRVMKELLLGAGYAIVSIDYRLAPETKLPGIVEDLRDAFAWVRGEGAKEFGLDPDRVAALGGSAGGYLALASGHLVEPPPKAIVSFYGYGDLVGPWYSAPDPFYRTKPLVSREEALSGVGTAPISESVAPERGRFYLWCRQNGLWPQEVMGIDPHTSPDAFRPYCPEQNVSPKYPPTLLLHGTADTDVPYQRSVDMARALQGVGVPHEFVTIEGEATASTAASSRTTTPRPRDCPKRRPWTG
jgi:acetyl esterase/lipase